LIIINFKYFCGFPSVEDCEKLTMKSNDLAVKKVNQTLAYLKSEKNEARPPNYTTNELQIPTVNTSRSHRLKPEKTNDLFSDQPFGDAKTTGTPTSKANDTAIKANNAS
jgi:hypothetical protein